MSVKRTEIYLYDSIGLFGDDAKSVVIDQIKAAGDRGIDLHINSPGGSVFDGYAIYNALLNHKPGVTVFIDGLAASIASYIAMAGNPVHMAENALIMVHKPTNDMGGGNAEELRKQADLLDKITISIVDAYARRTGLPSQTIAEMLDEETWLTADMAKAFGFVDVITAPLALAASFDTKQLSKFKNAPAQLKKLMQPTATTTQNTDPQNICCQPKEGEQPNGDAPVPPESPTPPETPPTPPEQPEDKAPFFARVAAIFTEKVALADLVSKHEGEIAGFKAQLSDLGHALSAANAKVQAYEKAEQDLKDAVDKLTKENKTASDRATDIVASMGFPKDNLPPQTNADTQPKPEKTAQQWLDEYNAITDPTERTIFYRANKAAILKANADLKKSEKNQPNSV